MSRLYRFLGSLCSALALAGVAQAQTQTPLVVKDGNGTSQNLCEYTLTNLIGCTAPHFYSGSVWGPQPADSAFRPYVNIFSLPAVSLTGSLPAYSATPPFKAQDSGGGDATDTINHAVKVNAPLVYNLLNPTVTYNIVATSGGTAYGAGQLICQTITAGCGTLPSFSLPSSGGRITGYHMRISDPTSTAWPLNATITIKEWSAQPTLAAGDHAAYALTTGTSNWIGDFQCTSNGQEGDGSTWYCTPVGPTPELKGVSTVVIALVATSGSGVIANNLAETATLIPSIEQ